MRTGFTHRRMRARAGGFSAVELMVTSLLGAILVSGTAQVFVNGRDSYRLQYGNAMLQENARFAMLTVLASNLRQAGFTDGGTVNVAQDLQDGNVLGFPSDNTFDGGINDSLTVFYASDTDCAANALPPGSVAQNTFRVFNGALECIGNSGRAVLVDGVDRLAFLLGEDLDGDGIANRYVRPADVTNWNTVVSVRVHLLVNSQEEVLHAPADYSFAGSAQATANDRRLRHEFVMSVELRN